MTAADGVGNAPILVGIDVGGTFTDAVALSKDRSVIGKVLSSPTDYSAGFDEALGQVLARIEAEPGEIGRLRHGTTVATNAVLTASGAPTGLLATRGFRDVLELRRLRVPVLYDLSSQKPTTLVPRRWRLEVDERTRATGEIERPIDLATVEAQIRSLLNAGVRSVAVSLLHSYANPAHEVAIGRLIDALWPELPYSLSSQVLPQIGEYERTSTTVVNAYVMPVVRRYLSTISERLRSRQVHADLEIMQSSGSVMSAMAAMDQPARIIESGPAAGVIAALHHARALGYRNVLSLDIGGTTAKASLIEDGEIELTHQYEVGGNFSQRTRLLGGGGHVLGLPAIDVSEIGAGGGSIISVDASGRVRVGPESAGAAPGPAGYGLGGHLPTLTDAQLVVGHLGDGQLLGGTIRLSANLAQIALSKTVARPLRREPVEAAHGALQIAAASMLRVLRSVSVERGRDPRDFVLMAYGGGGALHAAELAAALGSRLVIIPPAPGVFSAYGLLTAEPAYDSSLPIAALLTDISEDELEAAFARVRHTVALWFEQHRYGDGEIAWQREVDLRHAGQGFTLTVPLGDAGGRSALALAEHRFREKHELTYAHRAGELPVELASVRVRARIHQSSLERPRWKTPPTSERDSSRDVFWGPAAGTIRTPVIRDLRAGRTQCGPAVVEAFDHTIVIPPGCQWRHDAQGNSYIDVNA